MAQKGRKKGGGEYNYRDLQLHMPETSPGRHTSSAEQLDSPAMRNTHAHTHTPTHEYTHVNHMFLCVSSLQSELTASSLAWVAQGSGTVPEVNVSHSS